MRKIGDNTVCPYCKNEKTEPQQAPFLPLKTVVGGKYLIGKLVSSNAEGSTYYAFDLSVKRPVTLREFYPREFITRGEDNYCLVNVGKASAFIDEKSDYLKLWRALKDIGGYSALPDIYEVFEDLGTAYAAYEYLGETQTLREYLLHNTEQGFVSWEEARVLLMPVLSGLEAVHAAGIFHRGISPETLVVCPDKRVKLTGFSVADLRNEKSRLEAELFDGYAAVEQYGFDGEQGAFTDVYAFAAVLYRALIGSTPQSSSQRIANDKLMIPARFAEQLPAYVINALVNALQILPADRTATVDTLRAELSASPSIMNASTDYGEKAEEKVRPVPNPNPAPPPIKRAEPEEVNEDEEELDEEIPDSAKMKRSTLIAFGVSVAVCLAVLLTVIIILKKPASPDNETTNTTAEETSKEETVKTTENKDEVISVSVPSFKGEKLEDIKNNETYKSVLNFETDYVDSDEERGTIISQSLPKGTMVTSVNKRTIKLTVSDGRSVPSVENMKKDDAVKALKDAGFKSVETQSGKIASDESESNLVYSVVYLDTETNDWAAIPGDRRLSAKNKIILYYFAEYAPETEEQTTADTNGEDGGNTDETDGFSGNGNENAENN